MQSGRRRKNRKEVLCEEDADVYVECNDKHIYLYTEKELTYTHKCACTDIQHAMSYISDTYTDVAYIIFILYDIQSYI
jgi:hypothetical protein